MVHSEKQKLQKARAYFKFILAGLPKPVSTKYLTATEQDTWKQIIELRNTLLSIHDENSRILGLNVPEFKCFICNKPTIEDYKITKDGMTYNLCKKHFKEEWKN
tara:strand:+ start:664 stop:975 length:312 start_codon:yes stop_codon:yes gene_type:complete